MLKDGRLSCDLASGESREVFLEALDITKSFGGVQALKGVSLTLKAGEVHGLVGANGAGKSTLIRILAGLNQPDEGRITVDGQPVFIGSPQHSTELGMTFIHQELAFVPGMTVLQNIMLGVPKRSRFGIVDWRAIATEVAPVARRVGLTAPLSSSVRGLSVAEKWLINICRALVRKARLIVMDEPTASLSASEAESLLRIVEDLSASGVSVLYVSHRLDEILRLCHRVTAFRDGRSIATMDRAGLTRPILVEAIVGSTVQNTRKVEAAPTRGEVVLAVEGLTRLPRVRDIALTLHRSEILGIGGLVGAGRTELARLLYGADRCDAGQMMLAGRPFAPRRPADAVRAGLGLVPEERRSEGLILSKSVAFNLHLSSLSRIVTSSAVPLVSNRKRSRLSAKMIADLSIRTPGAQPPVGRLSGGNQQKVVIGRWLLRAPQVLILDEPTRGVDVGARAEIHRLIRALARDGMAVLVISSEPDELPDLCDRVLVMAEGRIVQELTGEAISRSAIIEASYAEGLHAGVRPS
ncbi:ribose transport system ATP-binding protein [Aureimonas altamirensis DSM 21988]|uniref:ABC transporter n=2 Tax=Aureimonas altamirensis TaxID=370622 RepID=A0A0N7KX99_9HYPH|nr:sugar ABC transporter ATP-binding protein [Aureimonas altamirensis]BAT26329.1 ABC transporter [Aureimonas altamirensis]SHJ44378.1 ribose transport system ATP-binding protein [Aureimonas altamirensis DSM 21988]